MSNVCSYYSVIDLKKVNMGFFTSFSLTSCGICNWDRNQDKGKWEDPPRCKSWRSREDTLFTGLVIFSILFTILDCFISSYIVYIYRLIRTQAGLYLLSRRNKALSPSRFLTNLVFGHIWLSLQKCAFFDNCWRMKKHHF